MNSGARFFAIASGVLAQMAVLRLTDDISLSTVVALSVAFGLAATRWSDDAD